MMSIRSHFYLYLGLCITLIASITSLHGQSIKINAPNEVEAGQPFTISYQIQGGNGEAEITSAPDFGTLQLLYGPAFAHRANVSYINGRVSQSSSYDITYTILATDPGSYKITGPTISMSGKTLKSGTSTIKVAAATSSSSGSSALRPRGRSGAEQTTFALVAIPERTTVYEQEPLLVTYRTRGSQRYRIINYSPAAHKGFVSQDIQESSQATFFSERIDGTNYISLNLISEVIYPIASGEQLISSASAIISYNIADQENLFLSQDKQDELRSKQVKIHVKPLPQEGRPTDFSGAVGNFSIRYELDKQPWRTNEASSLKIIISGAGNLKSAKSPTITLPDNLELYDPIENNEQVYRNGEIIATRTIEYSLIPRKTGRIQLPALELSYFDPKTGSYRKATASAQTLEVIQGRNVEHQDRETVLQHTTDGKDTPHDIIKGSSTSPSNHHWSALGLAGYLGINLLLLILCFALYRYLIYRRSLRDDMVSYKATRAGKIASKRLAVARQKLEGDSSQEFYAELLRAIWGYLGDKLRLPQSLLNRSDIATALEEKGISTDIVTRLTSMIDTIEYARYTPASTAEDLRELYTQASHLIEAIEKSHR